MKKEVDKDKEGLLKKAIKILNSFKDDRGGVCNFAFYPDTINLTTGFYILKQAPCHAQFTYSKNCKIIVSDIFFNKRPDFEYLKEPFLDWILSEESPWGSLVPYFYGDKSFQKEKGIILTNLDFPANFIVNFFIATRTHLEHPDILVRWDTLVKKGISKNIAFALAYCYSITNDVVNEAVLNRGHSCLEPCNTNHVDHFVSCNPRNTTQLFSEKGAYRPCSATWNKVGTSNSYPDFLKKTYKDFLIPKKEGEEKKVKSRMFKPAIEMREQRYVEEKKFSLNDLVEISKLEEARIFKEMGLNKNKDAKAA